MQENKKLVFAMQNYIILLVGIAVLVLGFVLMASDTEKYGFGNLGLTTGPLTVVAGLLIQFVAILYKPKKAKD